ncbi:MAG: hypothetical protein JSS32_08135 [Verrucomicrobia bacterium]|nr:hypothetical protein [Verrucomicrobiota bacterium]
MTPPIYSSNGFFHSINPVAPAPPSKDPFNDLTTLMEYLAYFLVPGADQAGNTKRIQDLIDNIDTSKFTDLDKKYFADCKSKIAVLLGAKDYSVSTIFNLYAELHSITLLETTNVNSHMQDAINASILFWGAQANVGYFNAFDMSGQTVHIAFSDSDKASIAQWMSTAYSNLMNNLKLDKGEYTVSDYSYIMLQLESDEFKTAMTNIGNGNPTNTDFGHIATGALMAATYMNSNLPSPPPPFVTRDQINQLVHEIAYFLTPGANIQGNIDRIKALLGNINISGMTPLQQKYFADAKSNLLMDMSIQDFSAASLLRVYSKFSVCIGVPDATTDSHVSGYMNALNILLGSMMLQGKMKAMDLNGNFVAIPGVSDDDKSLLCQSMFISYQSLNFTVLNNKKDFSDADYSAIMSWLLNPDVKQAMQRMHQGVPTAADLTTLVSQTTVAILHFDTPTPAPSRLSAAAAEISSPNTDPDNQIRTLEGYLYGYLLPGMDIGKNTKRITDLLGSIDISTFTDTQKAYFNGAKAKILSLINAQDFSAAALVQTNNELSSIEALPNSPNTDSHFQGWIDTSNVYIGLAMLKGLLHGTDLNGNQVNITSISSLDKNTLYLMMAQSFQNLLNYLPAHRRDFTSDTYAVINTQLLQNSKLINDVNLLEQSALSGTDPDPSVIQEIANIVLPVLGYFNAAPPA